MNAHRSSFLRFARFTRPEVLVFGIAFLGAVAMMRAAFIVVTNRYLQGGLTTLALVETQRVLNRYATVFLFLLLLLALARILVAAARTLRFARSPGTGKGRDMGSYLGLVLASIAFLLAPLVVEYSNLDRFLRSSSFIRDLFNSSELLQFLFDDARRRMLVLSAVVLAGAVTLVVAFLLLRHRCRRFCLSLRRSSFLTFAVRGTATLAVFSVAAINAAVLGRGEAPTGPNVVLITIDTLRADHLSTYGYARENAPRLAALARESSVFERAFSQAPWTLPAMASVHTALYPWQHRAVRTYLSLSHRDVTIAEVLKNASYSTAAVVSHDFVGSTYGFRQGFDHFDESLMAGHAGVTSERLTDSAIDLLQRLAERQPFFLWIHYFDPHYDYVQHENWDFADDYTGRLPYRLEVDSIREIQAQLTAEDEAYIRDVYDEEIAFTDQQIGRLVTALRQRDLLENTLLVLTADHGEEFFERGRIGHGRFLYDELIRVPLLVRLPREGAVRGERIDAPVETRDIFRTILEITKIEHAGAPGTNLLDSNSSARVALSYGTEAFHDSDIRVAAVRDHFKLIVNLTTGEEELFDLQADPAESQNLLSDLALLSEEAAGAVASLRNAVATAQPTTEMSGRNAVMDEQTRRRLESLGYLD